MRITARALVACAAVTLLGFLVTACGKGYRQIAVVGQEKTEIITFGPAPKGPQEILVPGRTLVFRTDATVPGGPRPVQGKAGHIYRVNDKLEIEEVGVFKPTVPNDTLAYTYGT